MGRSWLCDENWGKKALEGREKDIRKCINCLRCFESLEQYNSVGLPAECALNPRCARELRYPTPEYDALHHTAVVVGGGPAGMIDNRKGPDAAVRASSIPSYAGGAAIDRESGFLREKKRNTRPESPLLFLLRVLS